MQQNTKNTNKAIRIHENWKIIDLFPDYEVSDQGNIKSKGRFKRWGFNNNIEWHDDIILSLGNKKKYKNVSLRNYTTIKRFTVHSLVMLMFVGKRPYKHDINHLNGNQSDNRLINLDYCTKSQNAQHAYNIGLNTGIRIKLKKRISFGTPIKETKEELNTASLYFNQFT